MPAPDTPAQLDPPKRGRHRTARPALTAREVRFCVLFVEKGNAYQCYLDAGFPPKATRHATDQAVPRTVRKREIREYIRHLQAVAAKAASITVEELAALMLTFAIADRRGLWGPNGLLPPDQWPDDVAACVDSIEAEEQFEPVPGAKGVRRIKRRVKKVKTVSRLAAVVKRMEWKRMLASSVDPNANAAPAPLVVGGEAAPDAL